MFFSLLDVLDHSLPDPWKEEQVPNGPVLKEARLSMALRFFAGGDKLDIACVHGVNPEEVRKSQWYVVDAIHSTPSMDICYPKNHLEQLEITMGFKNKSTINSDNCAGAIDGILIWIHQPSAPDVEKIGIGPLKFYCGRKKKFGLNMQAVCD